MTIDLLLGVGIGAGLVAVWRLRRLHGRGLLRPNPSGAPPIARPPGVELCGPGCVVLKELAGARRAMWCQTHDRAWPDACRADCVTEVARGAVDGASPLWCISHGRAWR